MTRDLKIRVDPGDIRVPEEGDFSADDQIDDLIMTAMMHGETGGQAFGLLLASIGTFADFSDQPLVLLQVAIDCLSADLEEQKAKRLIDMIAELPEPDATPGWQERVHAEIDEPKKGPTS